MAEIALFHSFTILYLLYVGGMLLAVAWPPTRRPPRRPEGFGPRGAPGALGENTCFLEQKS
jgi:hypothetical protein